SFLPSGNRRYAITGLTLNACGANAEVFVKPPLMSVKIMPYGRPCFLISSISIFSRSARGTLRVVSTTRLPWRATGGRLGERRPDIGLGERRVVERVEVRGHGLDHLVDLGVAGQIDRALAEALLEARQVLAVVRLDADRYRQLRVGP